MLKGDPEKDFATLKTSVLLLKIKNRHRETRCRTTKIVAVELFFSEGCFQLLGHLHVVKYLLYIVVILDNVYQFQNGFRSFYV